MCSRASVYKGLLGIVYGKIEDVEIKLNKMCLLLRIVSINRNK